MTYFVIPLRWIFILQNPGHPDIKKIPTPIPTRPKKSYCCANSPRLAKTYPGFLSCHRVQGAGDRSRGVFRLEYSRPTNSKENWITTGSPRLKPERETYRYHQRSWQSIAPRVWAIDCCSPPLAAVSRSIFSGRWSANMPVSPTETSCTSARVQSPIIFWHSAWGSDDYSSSFGKFHKNCIFSTPTLSAVSYFESL
jgi:hypothetical protein